MEKDEYRVVEYKKNSDEIIGVNSFDKEEDASEFALNQSIKHKDNFFVVELIVNTTNRSVYQNGKSVDLPESLLVQKGW